MTDRVDKTDLSKEKEILQPKPNTKYKGFATTKEEGVFPMILNIILSLSIFSPSFKEKVKNLNLGNQNKLSHFYIILKQYELSDRQIFSILANSNLLSLMNELNSELISNLPSQKTIENNENKKSLDFDLLLEKAVNSKSYYTPLADTKLTKEAVYEFINTLGEFLNSDFLETFSLFARFCLEGGLTTDYPEMKPFKYIATEGGHQHERTCTKKLILEICLQVFKNNNLKKIAQFWALEISKHAELNKFSGDLTRVINSRLAASNKELLTPFEAAYTSSFCENQIFLKADPKLERVFTLLAQDSEKRRKSRQEKKS